MSEELQTKADEDPVDAILTEHFGHTVYEATDDEPEECHDECPACVAGEQINAWLARVKAQALRDAADDWAGGEWRAVNFNRAGRDEPPWARQARWLRERADRIEAAS